MDIYIYKRGREFTFTHMLVVPLWSFDTVFMTSTQRKYLWWKCQKVISSFRPFLRRVSGCIDPSGTCVDRDQDKINIKFPWQSLQNTEVNKNTFPTSFYQKYLLQVYKASFPVCLFLSL